MILPAMVVSCNSMKDKLKLRTDLMAASLVNGMVISLSA